MAVAPTMPSDVSENLFFDFMRAFFLPRGASTSAAGLNPPTSSTPQTSIPGLPPPTLTLPTPSIPTPAANASAECDTKCGGFINRITFPEKYQECISKCQESGGTKGPLDFAKGELGAFAPLIVIVLGAILVIVAIALLTR